MTEKKTLKEVIALFKTCSGSADFVASNAADETKKLAAGERSKLYDMVVTELENIWDGSRESVIQQILKAYDETTVLEENGKPRKMTSEELVDFLERLRDKPYSEPI